VLADVIRLLQTIINGPDLNFSQR